MLPPIREGSKGGSIGLVVHRKPDGDALASLAIMRELFKKTYPDKKIHIITDYKNNYSRFPSILPNFDKKEMIDGGGIPEDCDVFILDHNHREISSLKDGNNPKIRSINIIDHHRDSITVEVEKKDNGEKNYYYHSDLQRIRDKSPLIKFKTGIIYIDEYADSTCEMIMRLLLREDSNYITKELVEGLYLGVFCDYLLLRIPFTNRLFDVLELLRRKFGVDFDDSRFKIFTNDHGHEYVRSIIFLKHCKRDESKKVEIFTIPMSKYKFMARYYLTPSSTLYHYMNLEGIQFGISLYEVAPDNGSLKFVSKVPQAMEEIFPNGHKKTTHTIYPMNEKVANELKDEILSSLATIKVSPSTT